MPARRKRISDADTLSEWRPPVGWKRSKPGVWIPADYHPTKWELEAPAIRTTADAREDWLKCFHSLPYFAFHWVWTLDVDDPSGEGVRKMPAYAYLRRFFIEVQEP